MSFASAVALANNGSPVGVDSEANLGHIDGVKGTPDLAAKHTAGFNCLAIPAVMPENPIGLGDRVPCFNIAEFAPVAKSGPDVHAAEIAPQRLYLFC